MEDFMYKVMERRNKYYGTSSHISSWTYVFNNLLKWKSVTKALVDSRIGLTFFIWFMTVGLSIFEIWTGTTMLFVPMLLD